jgi:drug/metabolite transporter (DMT)-like permease
VQVALFRRTGLARLVAPAPKTLAAFAVIYLVWGSTYLGIRWAVEAIPPLVMAGTRFLAAGVVLWLLTPRLGGRPTARDWLWGTVLGGLMLLAGNGFLSIAETRMPTGMAALLIASVPLWMALLEALTGTRPTWRVALGLALGFAGVGLLAGASEGWVGGAAEPAFVVLILVGSMAWAVGSLVSRGSPMGLPMLRAVAVQMACGGLLLLAFAGLNGEWSRFDPAAVTPRAGLAWLYLVLFGSVLAFSAYSWLLRHVAPSVVTTYAFVNPLVAVALGAAVLHEPLTWRTLAATLLIVGAVALITLGRRRPAARPAPAA